MHCQQRARFVERCYKMSHFMCSFLLYPMGKSLFTQGFLVTFRTKFLYISWIFRAQVIRVSQYFLVIRWSIMKLFTKSVHPFYAWPGNIILWTPCKIYRDSSHVLCFLQFMCMLHTYSYNSLFIECMIKIMCYDFLLLFVMYRTTIRLNC